LTDPVARGFYFRALTTSDEITFQTMLAEGDASLRAHLEGTDARHRLWAIWALAMRGGAATIAGHLATEPSAGVRRHMCIVLAGGELDLLVALARHDPDAEVRATASGLCARLAGGGRLPWALALEMLERGEPLIRKAVLREIPTGAPDAIIAAVLRATDADDAEVAFDAVGALLRVSPSVAIPRVARRLENASSSEAYALVMVCLDHVGGPAGLHEALLGSSPAARIAAMGQLHRRWTDLEPFARDPWASVRHAARRLLLGRLAEIPPSALVSWVDDGDDSGVGAAAAQQLCSRHVWASDALDGPARRDLRARCERRIAAIDAVLREAGVALEMAENREAWGEEEDDAYEYDGYEELRWERMNLTDLLALTGEH
jgi:hypothetical protein